MNRIYTPEAQREQPTMCVFQQQYQRLVEELRTVETAGYSWHTYKETMEALIAKHERKLLELQRSST
jgi:hypothetical protein